MSVFIPCERSVLGVRNTYSFVTPFSTSFTIRAEQLLFVIYPPGI